VRIDNTQRVGTLGGRAATVRASASSFFVDDGAPATGNRATAQVAAPAALDALLALQAVEDPLLRKKKLLRRGTQLLDALEEMRVDLLGGRASDGRLNQMMAVLGQVRDRADPRLDALLDDIELRARVELAKRGLYPA